MLDGKIQLCAYFGWKKHKNTMVEIEQNLEELKNFE